MWLNSDSVTSQHGLYRRIFICRAIRPVGEQSRIQPSVSWIAKSPFDPVSTSIGATKFAPQKVPGRVCISTLYGPDCYLRPYAYGFEATACGTRFQILISYYVAILLEHLRARYLMAFEVTPQSFEVAPQSPEELTVKAEELRVRRLEAKRAMATLSSAWWRRADPLVLAILAGALTLLGNMAVAFINNQSSIAQEQRKAADDLALEQAKARFNLVLQAMATNDVAVAKRNIHFFIDA